MKYVRKPEIIDAMQWLPNVHEEVVSWAAGKVYFDPFSNTLEVNANGKIKRALTGDYILKDIHGTVDTIPQKLFEETYTRYVDNGDGTGLPVEEETPPAETEPSSDAGVSTVSSVLG